MDFVSAGMIISIYWTLNPLGKFYVKSGIINVGDYERYKKLHFSTQEITFFVMLFWLQYRM